MQLNYIVSVFLFTQSANAAFDLKDFFNRDKNYNNTLTASTTNTALSIEDSFHSNKYAHTHSSHVISANPTDQLTSTDILSSNPTDQLTNTDIIPSTTTSSQIIFPSIDPSQYQKSINTYSNIDVSSNADISSNTDSYTTSDTQLVFPTSTSYQIASDADGDLRSSTTDSTIINSVVPSISQSSIDITSTHHPLFMIPTTTSDGNTESPTASINHTLIDTSSQLNTSMLTVETPLPTTYSPSSIDSSSTLEQIIVSTSTSYSMEDTTSTAQVIKPPGENLPHPKAPSPSTTSANSPTESSIVSASSPIASTPATTASFISTVSSPAAVASSPAAIASSPTAIASSPTSIASSPTAIASSPAAVASSPTAIASSPTAIASSPTAIASSPTAIASTPTASAPSPGSSSTYTIPTPTLPVSSLTSSTTSDSKASTVSEPTSSTSLRVSTPPSNLVISPTSSTSTITQKPITSTSIISTSPEIITSPSNSTTLATISTPTRATPAHVTVITTTSSSSPIVIPTSTSQHIIVSFDPSATSTTTTTLSYPNMPVSPSSNMDHATTSSSSMVATQPSVTEVATISFASKTTVVSTISQSKPEPSTTKNVVISSQISINDNVSTTVLIASTSHVSVVSQAVTKNDPHPTTTLITSTIPSSIPSSVSSEQDPNWWVPTQILTDSVTATVSQQTLGASETANIPQMIMSPDGDVEPAIGYSLITIGFKRSLNYEFVVSSPQSSVQILSFLPDVLNNAFNDTLSNVSVIRLVPLQDDSIPYLVTIAEVYFPETLITELAAMIKDESSILHTKKTSKNVVNTLAQLIDPSIPITGLIGDINTDNDNANNNDNGNSHNGNNSNQSYNNNDDEKTSPDNDIYGTLDGSSIGSLDYNNKNANGTSGSAKPSKKKIAGIVIGAVFGAFIYFAAMWVLLRYAINRYKKQDVINYPVDENSSISSNESSFNEKMNNSPSWSNNNTNSNTNTVVSEEIGIAINAKRGKSVKLKISGPLASENSLGF